MKKNFFFILFISSFFFNYSAFSSEKVVYLDVNYIMSNSKAGKYINKKIEDNHKKNINSFQKIEENLKKEEEKIVKKRTVLSKEDFENEVNKHQKNVDNYHAKQKQDLEKLGKKNLEMSKNFMTKIDKIIMNYAKENSIDLLLKRETLIVSNSQLDITKDILAKVNNTIKKID